ncbi:hypothetical protein [Flavobacterium silvaticum]|uniref:Uncharacterized protein n=1 Tax=Flavobacterium silvaticum TaxID=1852020 RepID=A0A972FJ86_9FLAO|nr:hypothetical protein [Flavobacterium silvaticum]NMH26778.1 hypothetical protein [Flavobacterium silvaticum]
MKNNALASFFKTALVIAFFALPVQAAFAQDEFDEDVDDETPQTFIDGFVVVGLAAGAVYGLTRVKADKE